MSNFDDEDNEGLDLEERPAKLQKIQNDQFDRNAESTDLPAGLIATNQPKRLTAEDGTLISKSQLKRLRKKAEWEAKKPQWKALQKEKRVAKRERKKAAKQESQQQQLDSIDPGSSAVPRSEKPHFKPKAVQLPITFILDCDFDNLMNERERISLASQITRCYSDNGKSRFRAHLAIASFGGQLRQRFETVLVHYKAWKGVRTFDEDFVAVAEKAGEWMREGDNVLRGAFSGSHVDRKTDAATRESHLTALRDAGEIVYLSSEADEDLVELKPYSTYIIGGLVDKNREKGICHRRATERGVRTARLPIGEFMDMASRKVLATNHVNEIMLKWLECRDWGVAFDLVIPKRKGGKLKGAEEEQHEEDEAEQAEEEGDDGEDEDEVPDHENDEADVEASAKAQDDHESGGVSLATAEEKDSVVGTTASLALPS